MNRKLLFVLFLLVSVSQAFAQNASIVSKGSGDSKQTAINDALGSALQAACGAFVVNRSELVDDVFSSHIMEIRKGNVSSYNELDSHCDPNGLWHVTLSVTIGVSKIADLLSEAVTDEYGAVEIDFGDIRDTYAFNRKQQELNAENEKVIIAALLEEVAEIMSLGVYPKKVVVSKPVVNNEGNRIKYTVTGHVDISQQMKLVDKTLTATLKEITRINLQSLKNIDEGLAVETKLMAPTYRGTSSFKVYLTSTSFESIEDHVRQLIRNVVDTYSLQEDGTPIQSQCVTIPMGSKNSIIAKEIVYTKEIISGIESLGKHKYELE